SRDPREIDLVSPKGIVGRGVYDFYRVSGRILMGEGGPVGLTLAFGPTRPRKLDEPGEGGIEFTLRKQNPPPDDLIRKAASREVEVRQAEAELDRATATVEQA